MAEDAKAPAGQLSMLRRTVLYLLVFAGAQSMFLFMAYRFLPAEVLFFWRFPRPWGIWAESSEMIVPFCLFLSQAAIIYFGSLYAADAYFGASRRPRALRAAALAAGLVALLVMMHLVYAAALFEVRWLRLPATSTFSWQADAQRFRMLSLRCNWLPLAVALGCFAGGVAIRFFPRPSNAAPSPP